MTPLYYHRRMDALRKLTLLLALTITPAGAHAQLIRLPQLNLPAPQVVDRLGGRLGDALPVDLSAVRLDAVGQLLRSHRRVLEADPRGEPMVRRQVLAFSPAPAALAAAAAVGFTVIRTQELAGLGETVATLEAPPGMATAAALARLRALDPHGSYDFNHIYTGSGNSAAAIPQAAVAAPIRAGLVDGGVASTHGVFADARIRRHGCGGREIPSAHGTGVAALMVGRSGAFSGVAPAGELFAADIFCDAADGGSAERIAAALGWMAQEQVGVVNLSLVGPANATLERLVQAMLRRGHLLVAAVGNDGPAAAPLYPAAYPGVVGVTAVGRDGAVLPEAARGPHVMFAAPGSHMATAAARPGAFQQVRGTSFAAPVVSALLARHVARPDPAEARAALAALARDAVQAEDAGKGVVGMAYRLDPKKISRLME
jgi:subtilisin family serine protease